MVKRFKYRLERVLAYRTLVKDEKLKELLLKNKNLNDAEQRLQELEAAVLLNTVDNNLAIAAEHIKSIGEYSQRLKAEIEHQNIQILSARQAVEEARQVYVDAQREVEMLERHKHNKKSEHMDYVLKEDEKALDEIVVQRYSKQNKSEN